jgi:hypothetical protein
MGKGLNSRARNKQAALRQKMEEAKRQKRKAEGVQDDSEGKDNDHLMSDDEIRERNDRLRFEELLKKGSATVLNDYSSDGYLNKQQEEEEIDAASKWRRDASGLAFPVNACPCSRLVVINNITRRSWSGPHF